MNIYLILSIRALLALSCCQFIILSPLLVRAAAPEVRGTWLTTTNQDHIRTGANTEVVMGDLRNIGLNTVYVETWKNGYTNFPSQTLKSIIGTTDRNVPVIGATRDLVQETLIHAHRKGMAYYGWFEYGVMSQFCGSGVNYIEPTNPLSNYMKSRGWLLKNQAGLYADSTNGGFAFMNIAVPEVRQFIINMTLEAVNRYDLDGIQYDDHMSWPKNFGMDDTTKNIYVSETGNPSPTSPSDPQFTQWRQQKVANFSTEMYNAVKSARPDLKFSLSPSITPFSTTEYNSNWPLLESQNVFDEFVPQMYRSTLSAFNSIPVSAQVAPFLPDDKEKLVFGLRINGDGPITPYVDLEAMIQRGRTEGVAGHSLWYSNGVREHYKNQLTAFYDVAVQGQAQNPNFAADHRPAPLVGASAGASNWDFTIADEGRYRVVAKIGSFWTEYNVAHLTPGAYQFNVPSATFVELLVDRRSATSFLGDFDGDEDVDGRDFLVWQRNIGMTTGATAAHGDANADGKVDAADLLRLRQNYGWSVVGGLSGIGVPEPSHVVLFVQAIVCIALRRPKHLRLLPAAR
ncbi:MAG: family 10 glycosylhydrolase [Bythopirellula sp.]|nr:family 10 glycosylhydrolase [Bythopirellula sp.]